jgi:hypothetical protein
MATIIKDVKGGKLRLSKKRLTEVTGFNTQPFYLKLADLSFSLSAIRIYAVNKSFQYLGKAHENPSEFSCVATIFPDTYEIGCRTFSKRTFNKILRAAGAESL